MPALGGQGQEEPRISLERWLSIDEYSMHLFTYVHICFDVYMYMCIYTGESVATLWIKEDIFCTINEAFSIIKF